MLTVPETEPRSTKPVDAPLITPNISLRSASPLTGTSPQFTYSPKTYENSNSSSYRSPLTFNDYLSKRDEPDKQPSLGPPESVPSTSLLATKTFFKKQVPADADVPPSYGQEKSLIDLDNNQNEVLAASVNSDLPDKSSEGGDSDTSKDSANHDTINNDISGLMSTTVLYKAADELLPQTETVEVPLPKLEPDDSKQHGSKWISPSYSNFRPTVEREFPTSTISPIKEEPLIAGYDTSVNYSLCFLVLSS